MGQYTTLMQCLPHTKIGEKSKPIKQQQKHARRTARREGCSAGGVSGLSESLPAAKCEPSFRGEPVTRNGKLWN